MAVLTDVRRSLWRAIDNWPELRDVFRLKLTWEKEQPLIVEAEPAICDFPMIEIVPASAVAVSWHTNTAQEWGASFEVKVWTQGWALPAVEDLAEKIARAVYQSAPEGSSVPYVKEAVGLYPRIGGPSIAAVRIGEVPEGGEEDDRVTATLLRLPILLAAKFRPFG